MRVEERPVITLPQFWLEPLENLFEETLDIAASDDPKLIWERPPAGAWMRVEERPVITLPQFWLEPLENLFEETTGAALLAPPKLIEEAPPPALRPRA